MRRCCGARASGKRADLGAAGRPVRVLDRPIDQLDGARAALGLDPPPKAGEPASEVGPAIFAGRCCAGIALLFHPDAFTVPAEDLG